MDLQVRVNKVEFDKAQAVHRYYMSGAAADVIIELPKTFKKFEVGREGKISLIEPEKPDAECKNGFLLCGRVLSIQNENKKAILSFGGLMVLITLKEGVFSDLSEGSSVCLCVKGFGVW